MLMPDEDEDGGPVDEYVTGTVTLARTHRMSKALMSPAYTDFGLQNITFLVI